MSAFIIFGAGLFCILFFILGSICKGCAAVVHGLINSIGITVAVTFLTGLACLALFLLYAFVDAIITDGFWAALGTLIGVIIIGGIGVGLIAGIGEVILSFFIVIADAIIEAVSNVLEKASELCERGFIHFLQVIINRTEKN